jgi:aspartyl aminopeptidase
MDEIKTEGQKLQDTLFYETKTGWDKSPDTYEIFNFCEGYINFLNKAKNERESVKEALNIIKGAGFRDLEEIRKAGERLKPGDKVYQANRGKTLIVAVIGSEPITSGINAVGAHIDSPRIDLKQNPLYEDDGIALFKTHYYGGIKKYQWTAVPLSLHGVIVKKDGSQIEVSIGENDSEPVFCITDLLPHLAKEQMEKKMTEAIPGENLNIIVGSIPFPDEKVKDKVKLNILKLLNDRYGIEEQDFLSAEIEMVPSYKAKSLGFDSSLIGGYGQDDRIYAYTSTNIRSIFLF